MEEQKKKKSYEYDGIYFLPCDDNPDDLIISYFDFKEDMAGAEEIEGSSVGPKYHIAFFKSGDDGIPVFDEAFEAILACPGTYISNLVGAGVYGCVVKKTTKSEKWFEDYLKRTLETLTIRKLKRYAEAIANN